MKGEKIWNFDHDLWTWDLWTLRLFVVLKSLPQWLHTCLWFIWVSMWFLICCLVLAVFPHSRHTKRSPCFSNKVSSWPSKTKNIYFTLQLKGKSEKVVMSLGFFGDYLYWNQHFVENGKDMDFNPFNDFYDNN